MIAPYVPRGPWGFHQYPTAASLKKLDPNAGELWEPDRVLRLPQFPSGKIVPYPFFRPTIHNDPKGRPRPFMRAGSPLDMKSGVYLIYDAHERAVYVGSSWGTSKQGNMRRTAARHWQSWRRHEKLSDYVTKLRGGGRPVIKTEDAHQGGFTFKRRDIFICAFPLENDDARVLGRFPAQGHNLLATRQLEAWLTEQISEVRRVVGYNQIVHVSIDDPDRSFESVPF